MHRIDLDIFSITYLSCLYWYEHFCCISAACCEHHQYIARVASYCSWKTINQLWGKTINLRVWMKEICTLLVKLHIIFSRMQRPSIIQVGCPTCCYQVCALDHANVGTADLDYSSGPCHRNDCRPTLSIMPLRVLSTGGGGSPRASLPHLTLIHDWMTHTSHWMTPHTGWHGVTAQLREPCTQTVTVIA